MFAGYAGQEMGYRLSPARGLTVRSFCLFLLWLTLASSSLVLFEPAPFDGLMASLLILLPLAGLSSLNRRLMVFLLFWLMIGAAGIVASTQAENVLPPVKHIVVSIYLSGAAVLVASVIHNNPTRHVKVIMAGLIIALTLAAIMGILGYFKLIPGAYELLTKFDRAKGAFKDPNVYGAFLAPALVYAVHRMMIAPPGRAIMQAGIAALVCVALLVSYSRGAWLHAALSLTLYAGIAFLAAQTNRFRLKLFVVGALGVATLLFGLVAILQVESVASIISQRASLAMGYDMGPQGRFGGQLKALSLVAEYPLGLGALEFARVHHHEDVHNVYLSMFLNTGWVGGFLYLGLVIMTLATALSHSMRRSEHQGLMIVMLASFAGLAVEGAIVDSDHWRHFYILTGIIWGLAAASDKTRHGRNAGVIARARFRN